MSFDFSWGIHGLIINIAGQAYTFNRTIASIVHIRYISPMYLLIGLLLIIAIIAGTVKLIKKRKKK